ncbi:hypothetical protein [Paenibacillus odorifer]|nr:hypothetical protein [Paenibacillus odorifer]
MKHWFNSYPNLQDLQDWQYRWLGFTIHTAFSGMLCNGNRNLMQHSGFSYNEVIALCIQLGNKQNLDRFKVLLPSIKSYVAAQLRS